METLEETTARFFLATTISLAQDDYPDEIDQIAYLVTFGSWQPQGKRALLVEVTNVPWKGHLPEHNDGAMVVFFYAEIPDEESAENLLPIAMNFIKDLCNQLWGENVPDTGQD
jgi:hypothetical protein